MVGKPGSTTRGRATPRSRTPDSKGRVNKPVEYGEAVVAKICEGLARGESWSSLCNTKGLPSYRTLYVWQDRYPEFAAAVARARQEGADSCADEALAVAKAATKETVQRDRLLVATLMRRAALLAPKAWSGKVETARAPKAQPLEVVFRVRHFEKVVGPDGKATVREIKPEGEA